MATNTLLPPGWITSYDPGPQRQDQTGNEMQVQGPPPVQGFRQAFLNAGFNDPMYQMADTGFGGEDRFTNTPNPAADAFAAQQGWQTASRNVDGWTQSGLFDSSGNLIQRQDYSNNEDAFTIAGLLATAVVGGAAFGAAGAGTEGVGAGIVEGGGADIGAGAAGGGGAVSGGGGTAGSAIAASAEGGGADIGAGAAGGGGAVSNSATGVAKVAGETNWLDAVLKYGTPIASALLQKNASDKANSLQQDAATAALKQQKDQYDTTRADTAPWRAAGTAALDKLMGLMNSGELTSKFSGMNPMEEKGYAFAAKEGQRAIDARARGAGGDVLRSSTQFAEDNANKFYGDAFNRFQTEKTNSNNPLFQLAGFGPQANQQSITAGQNAADNSSSINLYGGAAAGQNALRTGNIYGNVLNQLAGWYDYRNPPPKSPG